jgi:hypothetical protein
MASSARAQVLRRRDGLPHHAHSGNLDIPALALVRVYGKVKVEKESAVIQAEYIRA